MTTSDITVAFGDGIGPEIMDATLFILKEAKARLNIETIEIGSAYYNRGVSTGIPPGAWDSLRRTKVLLKAPITTPQGGGYKSINVTIRKTLGLYANVRPCRSYAPLVQSLHPMMDLVIIRENEEDLYSGIEYHHATDTYTAHKVITESGSEKIIRYAFDYALQNGRRKVTCMSKDNIMKMCDGIFHRVFDRVAKEYPDIETDHYIIDIGAARVASRPESFDVIVTQNLYGDIISDIAAEVSGSVGLAGSSNVGDDFAMFEAIHGSAPDIAGQDIANPSGLLAGAVMMLVHLGQNDIAGLIRNAWLKTIEDGIHTADIYSESASKEQVGTAAFARAVVERLGQQPYRFRAENYDPLPEDAKKPGEHVDIIVCEKTLVGVDIFVSWHKRDLEPLGQLLQDLSGEEASLALISCKGLKVWPDTPDQKMLGDCYRCRFKVESEDTVLPADYPAALHQRLVEKDVDVLQVINLFDFCGELGFTKSQGE
ncbi:MAG: NADP-dependent isocitrate dehydrogenase [Sphaerospermopsis sp. SIO1G2]|nr:NADP-dependent isocitrate dehydrogenase [Sphaerospermopsis sp. SIO1G2]